MFMYVWTRSAKTSWKYAHVTSYAFPLEHVDDVWDILLARGKRAAAAAAAKKAAGDGDAIGANDAAAAAAAAAAAEEESSVSTSRGSARTALQLLTDEDFDKEVLNSSQVNVLKELLQHKWSHYAGGAFLRRFAAVVVYLVLFAVTVIIRGRPAKVAGLDFDRAPAAAVAVGAGHFGMCSSTAFPPGSVAPWAWWAGFTGATDAAPALCYAGIAGEAVVLAGAVVKLVASLFEMRRVGVGYYFRARGAARLERTLSLAFAACIFGTMYMTAIKDHEAGRVLLSLGSVVGVSLLLVEGGE
jgi:hypothetical protein